ncbi:NmrA family NAD(P)-binding protein [Propionimicrobium sp. PCR01-08-3]|uniref:NmrA family NAD(P)-binding protein n=1 Tax=Propionimicrobium sp. PCR01-08-3 TaxID=3052086 RepID=UPI00255C6642|nr:NmrA family NAD(P)-binding protein [Propionimicrobium sp. PCR01-08-3]WIY82237.1 NAD(P)H-binding protein [Propionimicrobium sp. PCR01-08-3]
MYVVAGATGRVGSAVARQLLSEDAEVRALVRRQVDADGWEAQGAGARIVSLDDRSTLTEALAGCAGFFALLPFDLTTNDLNEHTERLVESIAGAVAGAAVPHVVLLSSGGADLAEGTGPIAGLHCAEVALRATGTVLSALRSVHFQEKLADVLDTARESGIYPVFAGSADVSVPMVATADLGAVAADVLQSPPSVSEAIDVLGPSYSERAVAAVLGRALGQELTVEVIPEEVWADVLTEAGFRPRIAASLAELYRADQQGLLAPRGDRQVSGHTPIDVTIDRLLAAS